MTKSPSLEDTIGSMALGLTNVTQRLLDPRALLWFGQTEGAALFLVIMGSLSDRLTGHLQTRNGRDAPIPRRLLRCSCE